MSTQQFRRQHYNVAAIWTLIMGLLAVGGCSTIEPAEPISTEEITNELLTSSVWLVADVSVEVDHAPLPPAVLVDAAETTGELAAGTVELTAITPPYVPFPILFTDKRVVLEDPDRVGNYEDLGSRYNVLDGEFMTFSLRHTPLLLYTYLYQDDDQTFVMNADGVDAQATVEAWGMLLDSALDAGVPDLVADAIVDKLYGNEAIRAAIDEALTDIIYGRIESRHAVVAPTDAAAFGLADLLIAANVTLPHIDREALAEALAEAIEELKQAAEDKVDQLVDALVDALLDKASEVINTELPPEQLENMISQKLYSQIEEKQDLLSSIRSVEIVLERGTDDL